MVMVKGEKGSAWTLLCSNKKPKKRRDIYLLLNRPCVGDDGWPMLWGARVGWCF